LKSVQIVKEFTEVIQRVEVSCDFNSDESGFELRLAVVDEPRFLKKFKIKFDINEKEKSQVLKFDPPQPEEYYVNEDFGADGNCGHFILGKEIMY